LECACMVDFLFAIIKHLSLVLTAEALYWTWSILVEVGVFQREGGQGLSTNFS